MATAEYTIERLVFDLRMPPPVWFWFGDVERLAKWLAKARATVQVDNWTPDRVLLKDPSLNILVDITQRRVNISSQESCARLEPFQEFCELTQRGLENLIAFDSYARVGALVLTGGRRTDREAAFDRTRRLLQDTCTAPSINWPAAVAFQVWLDAEPETLVRRSLKFDIVRDLRPVAVDPNRAVRMEEKWHPILHYDRFIESPVKREALKSGEFLSESMDELRTVAQDYGIAVVEEAEGGQS